MKLTFVTSNTMKVREVAEILACEIEQVDLDLPEIQSLDPEEVVRHKAEQAFAALARPVVVEDTSFFVEAWNDCLPGPLMKWFVKHGGTEKFLKMLETEENRNARGVCAVAYHDGSQIHTFVGEIRGEVTRELRGTGEKKYWDYFFLPTGSGKTYGEMTIQEKTQDSHRTRAFRALDAFLR